MKDNISYVGPAGYGDNIKFIANYLFKYPGCGSTEIRRALCLIRGKKYTRGQYTSYFSNLGLSRFGSISHKPECGRYWRRIKKQNGRNGYLITIEGMKFIK